MKIIQVIADFGLAGAETMVEHLSSGLIAEGHDVLIISLFDLHTAITDRIESRGIKIEYLGKKRGFDPSVITKMRKIIKAYKPDIINTHRYVLPYVFMAAFRLNINLVHTVHNVAQKEQTNVGKRINKILFRFFDVLPIALSKEVQKTIHEVYGLPTQRIPVIFNGIDLSKCIVKQNYKRNKNFNIIHIGRFMDVKNHALLIRCFAQFVKLHPDARLQLLGDGERREEMVQLVKELDITDFVEFAGLQSNVYPWLHNADLFILPSKFEGMPMTLIEAMGTGLPIIASKVGGIPDMLTNNEDALLIKPTSDELNEAMERLYQSDTLREEFGKKVKERAIVFSSEEMAQMYIDVYKCRL